MIAKTNGGPLNNPGVRVKQTAERGMKLIVIDPRRIETARRAHVHLQPKPGQDAALLAAIVRIVIEESLVDATFVADNAVGLGVGSVGRLVTMDERDPITGIPRMSAVLVVVAAARQCAAA